MTLTIIRGNNAFAGELDSATAASATGGRVQNAIASASASTGVDFHYLYHQARIESGLNPNAKASTSSASGLYQFTEQTWLATMKQHGAEHGLNWAANAITRGSNGHFYVSDAATKQEIMALRQSPETSAAMAGEYASDNQDYLQAKLGRATTPTDLYMAHFLGPAGAARFLKALDSNPDASAASVMPAAAHANKWVFWDKSGNARSLEQVYQRFAARFEQSTPDAGSTSTQMASATTTQPTDTAADIARMQLAALNGTTEGTTVSTADATQLNSATAMAPSPQTARLAYLMLASLGV
ncbi:transglycosylase SLT domain-containing protein [Sphingomonas sp. CGMCC 1.13654]|uniref:Transglycosylase SLT domain-containing protein n=1 Tax=Sphingomonas chungangi TaxID=2683589 RepID=A0A838L5R1_9SPHN|nr:transglycosylase SLT domain-containing protein [Sphingomonas chungangi]MBA2932938.1 transglycosylase SLT domain-containing protein [Sphingomonas chungangi]MVW56558.1 transglycosylase SLT domain-containing protein [Sphingomonas chungangi]